MSDETRIHELLEELLDSDQSPEEICADAPDLLPQVRERWEQIRRVGHQIEALFPSDDETVQREDGAVIGEAGLPLIDGYDVESVLGRGGMGVVFLARHCQLKRHVALKMLLAGAYAGPQELSRFRREAEAAAALRHPQIVQVHDVGEVRGRPYIALEFVEGGSLAQKLAGVPLPVQQAAELVAVLAGAVQFAHQSGIIHRDLKPANILLTTDGMPKIADFGLARLLEAERDLTLTGARIGTPCYMAPEQAQAKADEIGPAVDLYALGVVLYECLTGKPPFQGASVAETEQQVIHADPVPPSQLNPRVSRDLETICLKCLHKTPSRRYASAQDLADDLHRYLDGRPVLARPVGRLERLQKWARRRPVTALLVVAIATLLALGVFTTTWMRQQDRARLAEIRSREIRARLTVEAALERAVQSGQAERWQESELLLSEAVSHLSNANSPQSKERIDFFRRELKFAQELEQIRQRAVSSILEHQVHDSTTTSILLTDYRNLFQQAGFDFGDDEQSLIERIQSSPFVKQTTAALDQWAYAALINSQFELTDKLLTVARKADPDTLWGNRFRQLQSWRNKQALLHLAEDVSLLKRGPPAHHLAILGNLLKRRGESSDQTRLLRTALRHQPDNFWLNWELAEALSREGKFAESATFLRVVAALRPRNCWLVNRLGCALSYAGELDESIHQIRLATELSPGSGEFRYNLATLLMRAGRSREAESVCRRGIAASPLDVWAYRTLGVILSQQGRFEEAIVAHQKAVELDPQLTVTYCNLGMALGSVGRHAEALAAFQKTVILEPSSALGHYGMARAYQDLGRFSAAASEYRWVLRELDPSLKRADADLPNGFDSRYVNARLYYAQTVLSLGDFDEAIDAAKRGLEIPQLSEARVLILNRILEISQQLGPRKAQIQSFLSGQAPPSEVPTQLALAECLTTYMRRPRAAVNLYKLVFEQQPELARDPDLGHRFSAACAAVQAAGGPDESDQALNDNQRQELRRQAHQWLQAERDAWHERFNAGNYSDQVRAAHTVGQWQQDRRLDFVRDPARLLTCPEQERADWEAFWADVQLLAVRDPAVSLERAYTHINQCQWKQSAEIYARLVHEAHLVDSEAWFEYAAVQLLAGDDRGYQETCGRMLEMAGTGTRIRAYLAARATTLAPDAIHDLNQLLKVADLELPRYSNSFWALTEQGAIHYRTQHYDEAVLVLNRSLETDARPGSAVLNWLWLALAHHQLGHQREARVWLDKSVQWLDKLHNVLPADAQTLGLHRHNWLEAQILRQEAETLIRSVPRSAEDTVAP